MKNIILHNAAVEYGLWVEYDIHWNKLHNYHTYPLWTGTDYATMLKLLH